MRRRVEMQSRERPQLADSGDIMSKTNHFDRSAIVWRGAADAHSYAEGTRAGARSLPCHSCLRSVFINKKIQPLRALELLRVNAREPL
jgi:hypothetical protein